MVSRLLKQVKPTYNEPETEDKSEVKRIKKKKKMEKENSFKSYSKVDDQDDQAFRRRTRKRVTIIAVSTIILLIITIGALIGIIVPIIHHKSKDGSSSSSSNQSIKAMCNVTRYPDSCYSSMSSALKASSNDTDANPNPQELFVLSLKVALNETTKLSSLLHRIISSNRNEINDTLVQSALSACEALFLDATDQISESITSMQVGNEERSSLLNSETINDIRTWLSSAITDLDTCILGLQETEKKLSTINEIMHAKTNSTEYTSNSLAIATNIMSFLVQLQTPIHRKLLGIHDQHSDNNFPLWVHRRDGRLLSDENIEANVTVANDGSGDFKSIREAVRLIPKKSKSRFIIYVKEGVYVENVTIHKDQWNVMVYGDGMNKTIISCSLNNVDGVSTFFSGTFIAAGKGFIARDVGFKNTAGPQKEQAVALRSSSDKSVFYRCSFDAYQDTLYTHTNRQFYKDCQITGTIDFIFGNAAVIFQNCTIQPRQPMEKQFNTITAQSKADPNQNTGISIQRCKLIPFDDLMAQTYLGRPWREYATTVVMQSFIGEFLDPLGWTSWDSNGEFPETIFYGEYQNVGAGSRVEGRVDVTGVRTNITTNEAEQFTVEPFIHGSQWLPQAGIAYDVSL